MKKFLWVLLFAVSFFIKAVTVFGAEASKTSKTKAKELKPANVKVMTSETDSDESQSSEGESNASEMKIQNNITFGQVSSPIDYAKSILPSLLKVIKITKWEITLPKSNLLKPEMWGSL
jgi:hypothetical protein